MRDTVLFLDTTLRDGEQTPGVSFHLNDKVDFDTAKVLISAYKKTKREVE